MITTDCSKQNLDKNIFFKIDVDTSKSVLNTFIWFRATGLMISSLKIESIDTFIQTIIEAECENLH